MIGAGAGQQGRKSSRNISKLNYVGGQRPLEPRQECGVNAAKQAREFKQPEAKPSRSNTGTSDPSYTSGLIEGGN